MQSSLREQGYAIKAMQSYVLEAFGSVLGAFGGVLQAFWGQARPAHLRRMAAGWPPGGRRMASISLGALLGRLGGTRQARRQVRTPFASEVWGISE